MVNHLYSALSQTQWPPKRFTICLTFTHSLTHSYIDGIKFSTFFL